MARLLFHVPFNALVMETVETTWLHTTREMPRHKAGKSRSHTLALQ